MFSSLPKKKSIQFEPTTRPLIIIGQGESILSSICSPKNVGLGLMVSPNSFPKVTDTAELSLLLSLGVLELG